MKKLIIALLVVMLSLGLGTVAFATTTSDTTAVTTTIEGELVLEVTTPTISYTLNPTSNTSGSQDIVLSIATNAATYGVTAQVTTWDATPYNTIIAGTTTPNWTYTTTSTSDSGSVISDNFTTGSATNVLSSATGEANDDDATLACLMAIDYTVPDASSASATITFTASATY